MERSAKFDPAVIYMILLTEYASKLDSLLLFYFGSMRNIERINQTDWKSGMEKDFEEAMWRMKLTGGAAYSYEHALRELSLVGISKTVEGLLSLAHELTGTDFNIWENDELTLPYHQEVRCIRALNNVVKHSRSVIAESGGQSAKFLVEHCGYSYGQDVKYMDLDIPRLIYRVSVFCEYVSAYLTGIEPSPPNSDEDAGLEQMKKDAIPDFLNL